MRKAIFHMVEIVEKVIGFYVSEIWSLHLPLLVFSSIKAFFKNI